MPQLIKRKKKLKRKFKNLKTKNSTYFSLGRATG